MKVWLHSGPPTRLPRWGPRSTGDASPGAALLLAQILPVFSVAPRALERAGRVAPCRGAPRPSRCDARLSPRAARRDSPGISGAGGEKHAVGIRWFSYRRANSIVVSRRRRVRNPRTYLSEAGVVYLFAYTRSMAS